MACIKESLNIGMVFPEMNASTAVNLMNPSLEIFGFNVNASKKTPSNRRGTSIHSFENFAKKTIGD